MLKIYLKLLQKYRPSAGWTLAELMIAASMTLMVVMASGFGLIMILKENKVANATGEMQYDLNRAAEFINEEICVGVKQQGGMISHLRNEVEVLCSAASLPEFIEIDTQNIELNQSVMMSEISLPEGVELTSVLNDLQDQPVHSCSVTRASLEIDDDPVIGEDGEEVTDDAEASADSSQTDESQEEESNDN